MPLYSDSLDLQADRLLDQVFSRWLGYFLLARHFDEDFLVAAGWVCLEVDRLELHPVCVDFLLRAMRFVRDFDLDACTLSE